jgi:hypothetical protein
MRYFIILASLVILINPLTSAFGESLNKQAAPRLQVKNNRAIVSSDGKTLLNIPLEPEKRQDSQVTQDRAEIIGQCLVVQRGMTRIEGMESFPVPSSIELYTLTGKRTNVPKSEQGLFSGYSVTPSSGQLGAIFQLGDGAEGDVDKYLLLRADCTYSHHSLGELLLVAGDGSGDIRSRSDSNGSLVVENMGRYDRLGQRHVVSLIIKSDGTFSIQENLAKSAQ